MRALTRMRTLAAACALLLFVSGTAMAGWASKPMDRPGTPDPPPTEQVGEPDMGHGLASPIWRQVLPALWWSNPWLVQLSVPGRHAASQVSYSKRTRGRR